MRLETGRWRTQRDLPVWIALAVLLALGWVMKGMVEGRNAAFADPTGGLRLFYPAGWLAVPGSVALLEVYDPTSGAGVPTSLIITREARPADDATEDIVSGGILARTRQLNLYRVLSVEPVMVAGENGIAVSYAFVTDPQGSTLALERIPVVVRGLEMVVATGAYVYRIDFRADKFRFDEARSVFGRILREVRL